jgi:tRNA isopentenyl-2-thiomethyl-A-37 hydroxylase MiaE
MRRNQRRFPPDFAFKLSLREAVGWLQIATTLGGRNMKNLPIAYTEHGAVMAANVLNSERAILMSVEVVRAFIRLRRVVVSHERLAQKVAQLETAMKTGLADHNRKIDGILLALKQLITVPAPISKKRIGFAEERPAL